MFMLLKVCWFEGQYNYGSTKILVADLVNSTSSIFLGTPLVISASMFRVQPYSFSHPASEKNVLCTFCSLVNNDGITHM